MFAVKKMLTAAALALTAMHAGATTLSFQSAAAAGGGTDVNVVISDVTDLYGYNFSVNYNPLLQRVASTSAGNFLGAAGDTGIAELDAGLIFYAYGVLSGFVPGISGSGTLLSIHFDTLAAGVSPLTFSDVLFFDSNLGDIAVTALDGTLGTDATAVPEPTSALLLGIGGIAFLARRRGAAMKLAASSTRHASTWQNHSMYVPSSGSACVSIS